jgi:hypothetical protein
VRTAERLRPLQVSAWQFGRDLRTTLLRDYELTYGETAPPPATIGAELLTDFLGATVSYDELPLDCFAETSWLDGRPHVTVNCRTREITGVKDARGVERLGIWHEAIHVHRDLALLRVGPQAALPGMVPNLRISCHRDRVVAARRPSDFSREFFAEEAGRAAAVSFPHLLATEPFRDLSTSPSSA